MVKYINLKLGMTVLNQDCPEVFAVMTQRHDGMLSDANQKVA